MKTIRPFVLVITAFALALSACSQPGESQSTTLTPQLGPPYTDRSVNVATTQTGHIYAVTQGIHFEDARYEGDGNLLVVEATLGRYDRTGNLLWESSAGGYTCDVSQYWYPCASSTPSDVAVDGAGNAYTLINGYSEACDHGAEFYNAGVAKISAAGIWLSSIDVTNATDFAVDAGGNVYTIGDNDSGKGYEDCSGVPDPDPPYAKILRKYSASGSLVWEQKLSSAIGRPTVGNPTDVAVASNGNIYVVGDEGMRRYGNNGGIWWTKSGGADEVIVSGSNIVTRSGLNVRSHNDSGTQLWSKFIGGSSPYVQHMDGDLSGNVYIAGRMLVGATNNDAFVRKLNVSGASQWTRTYSDVAASEATGVATYNGSEIYITGPGYIQPNPDRSSNAYLYGLNSVGNRVWVR